MRKLSNISLILGSALLLGSCVKPGEEEPAVFAAPKDIVYDEVLSTGTCISIAWSADEALAGDAWYFLVELVESPDADTSVFSRKIKTYEPRPCNACRFTSLPEFGRYYVRAKAVYENGESAWSYLGAPSVVEAGTGIVEGSDTRRVREPQCRLKCATAGSLTVEWSVSGFEKKKIDREQDYKVYLYRDSLASDLEVAWKLDASSNVFEGSEAGYVYELDFPAFKFTGLEDGTPYWFKVETDGLPGSLTRFETVPSCVVVPGAQVAAEGECVLHEDFEEFIWGGDATGGAACYNTLLRYVKDSFVKAEGDNPVGTEDQFFVCGQNNEVRLYECSPELIGSTRFAKWGRIVSGNNTNELSFRSGCIRVGNSASASIATPALTNLQKNATLLLEFDAKNYYIRESRGVRIEVIGGDAKFDHGSFTLSVSSSQRRTAAELELNAGYEFQHYSIKIANVAPGSRIAFTGIKDNLSSTSRFYLDNVNIKVLNY